MRRQGDDARREHTDAEVQLLRAIIETASPAAPMLASRLVACAERETGRPLAYLEKFRGIVLQTLGAPDQPDRLFGDTLLLLDDGGLSFASYALNEYGKIVVSNPKAISCRDAIEKGFDPVVVASKIDDALTRQIHGKMGKRTRQIEKIARKMRAAADLLEA